MARHVDDNEHIDAGKTFDEACYPSTVSFVTKPSEFDSKLREEMKCRRPGGMYRGKGLWHVFSYAPEVHEKIMGKNGDPS